MTALIIEDESGSAQELRQLIAAIDNRITVEAILESVEDAVSWFAAHPQPDLIFSDIQLADGLSFEIFRQVHISCPIIFCTAYDEYLMNAFETNAISYILKPISKDKLKAALDKLNMLRQNFQADGVTNAQLQDFIKGLKPSYKSTILVSLREKLIPVLVKEVAYFYMENSIVEAATVSHQKYFLAGSLDEMEKILDPDQFFRANRQFLVNRAAIANAERSFSRKLIIQLTVPTAESIVVSKAKASEFLHWLQYL